MVDGFLGRWSKRKLDAKEGKPLEAVPAAPLPPPQPFPEGGESVVAAAPAEPPPLTLEDAQALTTESDFRPFAARGVAPEVRNAAMKTLFSDPHFNVMDRLDTYIDDYSQPDPMPESMLRELVAGKFLKLFEPTEDGETPTPAAPRDDADNPAGEVVAQSPACNPLPGSTDNADPDLRLQQDDAPAGKDPGRGTA